MQKMSSLVHETHLAKIETEKVLESLQLEVAKIRDTYLVRHSHAFNFCF